MISKELLSEVLGKDILSARIEGKSAIYTVDYETEEDGELTWIIAEFFINIYELANKCKEWAFEEKGVQIIHARKYGYSIGIVKYFSSIEVYNGHYLYNPSSELGTSTQLSFEADTEPEAIFKACEWILDNKE